MKFRNKKNRLFSNLGLIRELQQQVDIITKIENKPTNSEGNTGDKKIVKEGNDFYLYYKIEKQWYKTELEKA